MRKLINIEGDTIKVNLEKPLTAIEAADLEGKLRVAVDDERIKNIEMDLKNVEYISSAGLRVFLAMHRLLEERSGKFVLQNVNDEVLGTIRLTGFEKILNIE